MLLFWTMLMAINFFTLLDGRSVILYLSTEMPIYI